MDKDYNLSFGQVIDSLKDGQIAEMFDSGYIVKRNGRFYWGTDENTVLTISESYMKASWRITPFFEERLCTCGCEAPLKPMTEAYSNGKLAARYHGEYYNYNKGGIPCIGLIE
jgi:hypothetical protein